MLRILLNQISRRKRGRSRLAPRKATRRALFESLEDRRMLAYSLGGPDGTLTTSSFQWSWDYSGAGIIDNPDGFRGAITNPAYFGPTGIVSQSVVTSDLTTITPATLTPLDGFVSSWWVDSQSAPYVSSITNFFLAGGDLLLLQDDSNHDAIGAALGIPTSGSAGTVSNGGAPLFEGPFGVTSNVTQTGSVGQLNPAHIASRGGHIGATNTVGQVTAAYWEEGEYAPGAGRLLIIADVDMFSINYGTASYYPLNSNGTFALNGAAFLVGNNRIDIVDVAPDPRNQAVDTVDVVFADAIVGSSFDYQDITLTRDGGSNLITSAVSVSNVSGNTYRVSALTALTSADGTYTLSVNGAGITLGEGGTIDGSASDEWTTDTTPPTPVIAGPSSPTFTVFDVDIDFGESVNNFVAGDITVGNGSINSLTDNGGGLFTAQIAASSAGLVTVDVNASVVADLAGNDNHAAAQFSVTTDPNLQPPLNLYIDFAIGNDVPVGNWNGIRSPNTTTPNLIDFNTGNPTTVSLSTTGMLFSCPCNSYPGTKDWVEDRAGDDFFYTDTSAAVTLSNVPDGTYTLEFVAAYPVASWLADFRVGGAFADANFNRTPGVNGDDWSMNDGIYGQNWLIWNEVSPVGGQITLTGTDVRGFAMYNALRLTSSSSPPQEVSISAVDAEKLEGDSGATAFKFNVTRSNGSGAASVQYAVSGDVPDPADADDFVGGVLPSGTVNFADGQTSVPLVINVQGDVVEERNERFKVTLSDPSDGTVIDVGEALGIIIQNDDAAPVAVAGGPYEVFEGATVGLDASGSSDIDEPDSSLTFEWDFDNDGSYDDATGITPTFSAVVMDGPPSPLSLTVGLRVTDSGGSSDTTTTTIALKNADPVADHDSATTNEDQSVVIDVLANDSDPAGVLDPLILNGVSSGTYGTAVILDNGTQDPSDDKIRYTPNPDFSGFDVIQYTIDDGDGGTATGLVDIEVIAVADPPILTVSDSEGDEADAIPLSVAVALSDTDDSESLGSVTIAGVPANAVLSAGTNTGSGNYSLSVADVAGLTITVSDDANFNLTVTATSIESSNADVATSTDTINVVVNNVAPHDVVIDASVSELVFAVGSTQTFSGSFADVGVDDTHGNTGTYWTFSHLDETGTLVTETRAATVTPGSGSGTVSDRFSFIQAGVYQVTLTVTDDDGGTTTSSASIFVVYDPSAGFVTGGGWVNSPAGADTLNPTATGKANFGFVSKYKEGATAPTGQTEFQFKAGDLKFHSSSYEWLVVSGARAQYKGDGTINGEAGYSFMLTAIDGQVNGGGDVDKFRIKIWGANGVRYDNQTGTDTTDNATPSTAIGGGQIKIHNGGKAQTLADHGDHAEEVGGLGTVVSQRDLTEVVEQAIDHWAEEGVPADQLARMSQFEIEVASLPGSTLGLASNSTNMIWIDLDAAGHGWSTPTSFGGVDLLSTVTHELGHSFGLDHDVMEATLHLGQRSLPSLSAPPLGIFGTDLLVGSYLADRPSLQLDWSDLDSELDDRDRLFATLTTDAPVVDVRGDAAEVDLDVDHLNSTLDAEDDDEQLSKLLEEVLDELADGIEV